MVGSLQREVLTQDGVPLLDYMNGTGNVLAAKGDLPPIFATNGRQDGSIPWQNNPPFYTAMNQARQAFAVYWNDGDHGMSSQAPKDAKDWSAGLERYRLGQAYPAFSNCSDNRDYGNGDPKDGDLVGWINRGLGWRDLKDTPDELSLVVTANHPDIRYPRHGGRDAPPDPGLPRPSRRDLPGPPSAGRAVAATADANGRITVPAVSIADAAGTPVRVVR